MFYFKKIFLNKVISYFKNLTNLTVKRRVRNGNLLYVLVSSNLTCRSQQLSKLLSISAAINAHVLKKYANIIIYIF